MIRSRHLLFVGAAMLAAGVIANCASPAPAPVLQPRADSPPPTPTVNSVRVASVDPLETIEPFTDTACLDCHTDQERLVTLAVEEEAPESLSSGPG